MFGRTNVSRVLFAVTALACLTAGIVTAAAVTQSITYQGKLTNALGSPLTGTYSVIFTIYDASTGGTALSTDTQTVTATNGLFTTPIAVGQQFFDGRELWLGIKVGSDPEMTPRQEIRPVPYAMSLRPGAWITATGSLPALDLLDTGSGRALNITTTGASGSGVIVTTTGTSGIGVRAITSGFSSAGITASTAGQYSHGITTSTGGFNSYGLLASTSGGNSRGVYSYTTGQNSEGVYAVTGNKDSPGVLAHTYGQSSSGVTSSTSGYTSHGFYASTHGQSSNGIFVETTGTGSMGVVASTSGRSSPGIEAFTKNESSRGVIVSTAGKWSDGMVAATSGDYSTGIITTTEGDTSAGISASTSGDSSNGISASTTGEYSEGVAASTTGYDSEGVYASTAGQYSDGVYAYTTGYGSAGVSARAYGLYSQGVYAYSEQSRALEGDTNNANHEWGVYTEDYIYGGGIRAPDVDVAEYMPVAADFSPGTVLIVGPEGKLMESSAAYDTRVAGIISTSPAIALGTKPGGNSGEGIVAISGRVPCRVDAGYGAIHPGDLLTTSETPGYAMMAKNPQIGTVLGKAMGSLKSGTGVIEVLVTLQ